MKIVKFLIKAGADVNANGNNFGGTPLAAAVESGNVEVMECLIKAGADVNAKDDFGGTPLDRAGTDKIIREILIKAGGKTTRELKLQEEGIEGHSLALLTAIASDDIEEVNFLIKVGVDVNAKSKINISSNGWRFDYGDTPLAVAVKSGKIEIMECLIKAGAGVNAKSGSEFSLNPTPLHIAADSGNIEAVKYLIKASADVNAKSNSESSYGNRTPLFSAVKSGNVEVMEFLIKAGADVNAKENIGFTPLFIAVGGGIDSGNIESVKCLIKAGADVNAKTNKKLTPFQYAKTDEIRNLLVKAGAEASAGDYGSGKQLFDAAKSGNVEAVERLTEAGADVNVKNNAGETPLIDAVTSGNVGAVERLIKAGANVNTGNKFGFTPLHAAVRFDNVVECLIRAGAKVNVKGGGLVNTPLHSAATYGNAKSVKYLIEAGADVRAIDVHGRTPLHLAARYGHKTSTSRSGEQIPNPTWSDYVEIVECLIKANADVNAKCLPGDGGQFLAGDTPLDVVKMEEIRELIIKAGGKETVGRVQPAPPAAPQAEGRSRRLLSQGFGFNAPPNPSQGLNEAEQKAIGNFAADYKFYIKDINSETVDNKVGGKALLHQAAKDGIIPAAKFLADNGANVDIKDDKGETPLHEAVRSKKIDFATYLVDKGADVNAKDKAGNTPLHLMATIKGADIEFIKFLVGNGARVNELDVQGRTPLHRLAAMQFGDIEFAKVLVANGANVDITYNDGKGKKTAFDKAKESNNTKMEKFLKSDEAKKYIVPKNLPPK